MRGSRPQLIGKDVRPRGSALSRILGIGSIALASITAAPVAAQADHQVIWEAVLRHRLERRSSPWLINRELLPGDYWSATGAPLDSVWTATLIGSRLLLGSCAPSRCPDSVGTVLLSLERPILLSNAGYTVRVAVHIYLPPLRPCGDPTKGRRHDLEVFTYSVEQRSTDWVVVREEMIRGGLRADSLICVPSGFLHRSYWRSRPNKRVQLAGRSWLKEASVCAPGKCDVRSS